MQYAKPICTEHDQKSCKTDYGCLIAFLAVGGSFVIGLLCTIFADDPRLRGGNFLISWFLFSTAIMMGLAFIGLIITVIAVSLGFTGSLIIMHKEIGQELDQFNEKYDQVMADCKEFRKSLSASQKK